MIAEGIIPSSQRKEATGISIQLSLKFYNLVLNAYLQYNSIYLTLNRPDLLKLFLTT